MAVHASHGRYTVQQVEEVFRGVGLEPIKVVHSEIGMVAVELTGPQRGQVSALIVPPAMIYIYFAKEPGTRFLRRRNVVIEYKAVGPRAAIAVAHVVLAELR